MPASLVYVLRYSDARKRTGKGKLKVPKYYSEMEEILGDKHKVKPVLVIDSAASTSSPSQLPAPSTSSSNPASDVSCNDDERPCPTNPSVLTPRSHRFQNVRSVRPPTHKTRLLEDLIHIQRENQEKRKEEFQALMKTFEEQNRQRHEQIMALISNMKKRKRGRHSSDSE